MLKVRDFFSFEAVYVCFLYGGVLKVLPVVGRLTQGVDLTLLATLGGILLAIGMYFTRPMHIQPGGTGYLLLYLLLVCWAVISWALISSGAYDGGEYVRRKVDKLVLMTSWSVLAPILVINSNERIDRVLKLIAAMGLLIIFPHMLKGLTNPLGTDTYQSLGRACGTSAVILATLLAFENSRARRFAYALGIVPLLAVLFWSGARQAIVGLIVALTVLPCALAISVDGRIRLKRYMAAALVLALIATVTAMSATLSTKNTPAERIVQLFQIGEPGGFDPEKESRPAIMRDAVRLWGMHPVTGAGFGAFANFEETEGSDPTIQWPHNLVLEILCELGLVGFVLVALLLGLPGVIWLRACQRPDNYIAVALGCAWIFHVTGAMFSWDINDNRMVWTLASMIVANAGFRKTMEQWIEVSQLRRSIGN